MDKETFYSQLSDKLSALGVCQEYIDRQKKQFDGYFADKSDDEVSAEIEKLGDLDRVAGRIKRMTNDKDDIEYVENEMPSDNIEIKKEQKLNDIQSSRLSSKVMSEDELKEKNKKFNIILACSSPVILIALLVIAFGFAFMFFALASVFVLAVAGLVAVTAGGTVISLSGLIFSVTVMQSCFPIGLYECGLGIMICAVAIFLGVAIYNFIVHFMPFVVKKQIVFVKYVIRKIKELFFYAKKEYIGS